MSLSKKPENMEEFCAWWDNADHQGKLEMCRAFGIKFDTGKHWRSESGIPHTMKEPPATEPPVSIPEILGEILALRALVKLDFVTFDIETTNLKADFSILLTACIKPFEKPPMIFRGDDYPTWQNQRDDDSQICKDVSTELSRHAVIITHYGTGFDIPYLRAKMLRYGLPPLPPMFGMDTYAIAKANFLISRRRLEAIANWLNLGKKSGVEAPLWMEAAYRGTRKSMDEILAHNIQDCELLEGLAVRCLPYMKRMGRI